jgi:archaeosine-15-forming tRNA-guanine transglycosylase
LESRFRCKKVSEEDLKRLELMLLYYFGRYAVDILKYLDVNKLEVCLSKTTSRPRAFLYCKNLFVSVRASDFHLIPHKPLAILLHRVLPFPKRRVVVVNEMTDDILKGHTVFAKHIILADETIRPFEEVLVVNEDDKLIGLGRALLDYETMITSTYGAAVQIREKVVDGENNEEPLRT